MANVDLQLSPVTKKIVLTLEEMFPELSKKYCPSRSGDFCEETERRCDLTSCPKMGEVTGKRGFLEERT